MADTGVLLFGYGLAGKVFHGPLISATPGLEIRAVVTSDPGRQAQVRADLPGARIVDSDAQAWADCADIDVVVIAGANRTHVPLALEAIARGKHVVIDKPIAGTAADAQRIADAAHSAGVQVHPFQNRRWDSDFLTLRAIAESGELGELHRFESRIERFRSQPRGTWRESDDPVDLGGVLLDFGSHLVDQALELMGPVRTVDANARAVRHANSANDDMQITLQHTSGALTLIVGSQAAAFGEPRFVLLGTHGGVRVDDSDTQETALRTGMIPGAAGWGLENFRATVRVVDHQHELREEQRELVAGQWDGYYGAIHAAITGQAAPPVPITDVIANLRVLDAARESAATGNRVLLSVAAHHG